MVDSTLGARWIRAALQVNPYLYKGANAPSLLFSSEEDYNSSLVAELNRLGVGLIAVTDHWCARTGETLIEDCAKAGIVALPGFEANSGESIHLLVIFPAGTPMGDLDAAIGACGGSPGCDSSTTGEAMAMIVEKMTSKGALVIASHVNTPAGLLSRLQGQAKFQAWKHPMLAAAGVSPAYPLTEDDRLIVGGRHSDCARQHPLTIVHADDISNPSRIGQMGGTSWFKMSQLSLESLRIALRASETRVRLDPVADATFPHVLEISWAGGYLNGVSLPFSRSLTTLIGGRGAGKSTVIESLRYVLDSPPIGSRALKDYKDVLDGVLQTATTVHISFNVGAPSFEVFSVERTVPDPPVVRDSAGTVLKQSPLDLIGPVEVFSQHELAELADDQVYMARMLGRFGGPDPDQDRRAELARTLVVNRKAQLELQGELAAIEERVAELPKLKEQLALFQNQGVDARLIAQEQLAREQRIFDGAVSQIDRVEAVVEPLSDLVTLDPAYLESAASGLPRGPEELIELLPVISGLESSINSAVMDIRNSVNLARNQVNEIKDRWTSATEPTRSAYAETVRSLREAGLDATRYLGLGKRIEELERQDSARKQVEEKLERARIERLQLLAEHARLQTTAHRRLGEAAKAANAMVKNRVIVQPKRSSDRRDLERLIQQNVPGQRSQIMAALAREDFSPADFVKSCRIGTSAEMAKWAIGESQARSLCGAGERLFLEVEEFQFGLAAEARLNVAADGTPRYKPLAELSKGQKATALLMLLLAESDHPLIIDQPEDNLDNRFIFDGIVDRLRELKGARQMIFATHNANVPVLGDAELVAVLEGSGEKGKVASEGLGSIDEQPIRAAIELLLEGGHEAFEARRHLYGY